MILKKESRIGKRNQILVLDNKNLESNKNTQKKHNLFFNLPQTILTAEDRVEDQILKT